MPKEASQRPLKILQIVLSLEPGGMENGVVSIANGLDPQLFETSICCIERTGEFAQRLRPSIDVTTLNKPPGFRFQAVRELAALIRTEAPDVLHTHNLGPLIYAAAARAISPRLWRTPILHGEHGALQGDSLHPRRLRQRRLLYRLCKLIHTVSSGLRKELIDRGLPASKIIPLLNGVDAQRFAPPTDKAIAKRTLGLPSDRPVIGTVGRFIATKRHELTIQAFERLASTPTSPHLIMVGDGGSEKHRIHNLAASSPCIDRIHLLGHMSDPSPAYQAMDLLVMPSSHEGLANALLESMASGVPVLAHSACGAGEVITSGVNGTLVDIQTAADLADAIEALIADKSTLERLAATALTDAQQRFSVDAMVAGYSDAYRRCCNGA